MSKVITNTILKAKAPVYEYKGIKNETILPDFVSICKMSQKQVKEFVKEELIKLGYEVITGDGFVYAKGTLPILLTAHMDTVHTELIKDFYEETREDGTHVLSSPQGIGGDDRCGIYMILNIAREKHCSILFCEDEEIGSIGADKFTHTEYITDLTEMKYLVELDRANKKDAVFYDESNEDFISWILENTSYDEEWGSFTDICTLSPVCRTSSVNFSCGYYNAHKLSEYVVIEEMLATMEMVKKLLDVECERFEYTERVRRLSSLDRYYYGYNYADYDDDDYYGGWYGRHNKNTGYGYDSYEDYVNSYVNNNKKEKKTEEPEQGKQVALYILYNDPQGNEAEEIVYGDTELEAWGSFFIDHGETCWYDVIDFELY